MLVLTRKIGEQIVLGDGIIVSIQRLGRHRVSIAIDAPAEVKVVRGELTTLPRPAAESTPAHRAAYRSSAGTSLSAGNG